ncbi:MAG: hypothetical protein HY000_12630 [Planctomycetes bacterium]|nr:hypothetical protein [Planctomycetota bacterium]
MAYRIPVNGVVIACDSPSEAIALARLANEAGTPKRGPGRPPTNGESAKVQKTKNDLKTALLFLCQVRDAKSSLGVNSLTLTKALELKGPRGTGAAAFVVNRVLREQGFDPIKVMRKRCFSTGTRWKADEQIAEALQRLQALVPETVPEGG